MLLQTMMYTYIVLYFELKNCCIYVHPVYFLKSKLHWSVCEGRKTDELNKNKPKIKLN